MTQSTFIKSSFNGGEISPSAEGRVDLQVYRAGARELTNFIVNPSGGFVKRPGTLYYGEAYSQDGATTGTNPPRLIPFVVTRDVSYMIEMKQYKMRFWKDGSVLNYSTLPLTNANFHSNSSSIYYKNHGFYHGQKVQITNVTGTGTPLPTGLAASTNYYVCLARPIALDVTANVTPAADTFTINTATGLGATHNLFPSMGPYRLVGYNAEYSEVFPDRNLYIRTAPSNTTFTLAYDESLAATFNVSTANYNAAELVPTDELMLDYFRLSTDPQDLEGTAISWSSDPSYDLTCDIAPPSTEVVEKWHPYTWSELEDVQYAQDESTMYFFHEKYPPMALANLDTSSFDFRQANIVEGPYGEDAGVNNPTIGYNLGTAPDGDTGTNTSTPHRPNNEIWNVGPANAEEWTDGRVAGSTFRMRWTHTAGVEVNRWLIGTVYSSAGYKFYLRDAPHYFDYSNGSNQIDFGAAHNLLDDDVVFYGQGTNGPAELEEGTPYFVRVVSANVIELAATAGGSAITITQDLTGADNWLQHAVWYVQAHAADTKPERLEFFSAAPYSQYAWDRIVPGARWKLKPYDGSGTMDADHAYMQYEDGTYVPVYRNNFAPAGFLLGRIAVLPVNFDIVNKTASQTVVSITGTTPVVINQAWFKDVVYTWHFDEWNPYDGWPKTGAVSQQRLICGNSARYPNRIWASFAGDKTNFSFDKASVSDTNAITNQTNEGFRAADRTITDDSGFSFDVLSGRVDDIQWIAASRTVIIGAKNAIASLQASTNREALTPTNASAETIDFDGVSSIRPAQAEGNLIYTTASEDKVMALVANSASETPSFTNLTDVADHVTDVDIVALAYQRSPYGILWALRDDYSLYACTYSERQGIAAWTKQELSGLGTTQIRRIAVLPATDDQGRKYDQLWLVVRRYINGSFSYKIEVMDTPRWGGKALKDQVHLDCVGTSRTTSGHSHLEGEYVRVWGDGVDQGAEYVSSGSVSSVGGVSNYVVGIGIDSTFESLPMQADEGATQTLQSLQKKVIEAHIRVEGSLGGEIGASAGAGNYYDLEYPTVAGGATYDGLLSARPGGDFDREAALKIRHVTAEPFSVVSVIARLEWTDR